jgi:Na+/H+ antiporter NhaA
MTDAKADELIQKLLAYQKQRSELLVQTYDKMKEALFIGKPLGVWFFARMSAKFRLAIAPSELSWGSLSGAAWLCGIGFTMSLFIAALAFGDGALLNMSKIGILAASLASRGVCNLVPNPPALIKFARQQANPPTEGVKCASFQG